MSPFKPNGFQMTSWIQIFANIQMLWCVTFAGLVPTTFVMAVLQSVGQRSWYLLVLTSICVGASSRALVVGREDFGSPSMSPPKLGQCGGSNPTEICASIESEYDAEQIQWSFDYLIGLFNLVLVLPWVDQVLRGLMCLSLNPHPVFQTMKAATTSKYWNLAYFILSSGFLGAYTYGFCTFFSIMKGVYQSNALDYSEWSFGQIVSVTVFLPPLFDLLALIVCKLTQHRQLHLDAWYNG